MVGVFDAGRTAFDSEVWGDVDQLMGAFRRNDYSVLVLKVPGSQAFKQLQQRLENDPPHDGSGEA